MTVLGKYQEGVTLYLDFTCPWSYIGWYNLSAAFEKLPAKYTQPLLIYRSHELNNNIELDGLLPFDDYMQHRFGDQNSIDDWQNIIIQAGLDAGLVIDFSKISHIFNTRLLHRMLKSLQGKRDLQDFLAKVFHSIIIKGKILNHPEAIYTHTGFDYHEIVNGKPESEWDNEIEQDLLYSRAAGVTGIPCYSFGKDYSLFGAQSVKGYRAMLDLFYETAKMPQQDERLVTFSQIR